jgi:RNA polymerase sigma-70 factor (ECF subfamily)
MIYLLFNEGYSASGGDAHVRTPLCEEAIRLARLLMSLAEDDPEIMGLTALLLLQHARTPGRLDADGAIILLEHQDRNLWNPGMIREGLALVEHALRKKRPGPYQVQAAIAAVHAQALRAEDTDWEEIERLYASLEALQASPVVTLNRAVAVSKVRGPRAALEMIEPLSDRLGGYFYYFGVRGALLMQLGRHAEARSAFYRALDLANTPAEAAHIRLQMNELVQNSQPV